MYQTNNKKWNQIRWFLLGFVPLFFFIRGIHLILTGGGWIATTNQPTHWVLLFLEIFISAFTVGGSFYVWYKKFHTKSKKYLKNTIFIRAVIFAIIFIFIIHFIRVGFWIQNSIL